MNRLNKLQQQLNDNTINKNSMKNVKGGGWFSDMLRSWWESRNATDDAHNGCPPPDND